MTEGFKILDSSRSLMRNCANICWNIKTQFSDVFILQEISAQFGIKYLVKLFHRSKIPHFPNTKFRYYIPVFVIKQRFVQITSMREFSRNLPILHSKKRCIHPSRKKSFNVLYYCSHQRTAFVCLNSLFGVHFPVPSYFNNKILVAVLI